MNIKRGDVVLAWYPFSSGIGGKQLPCLIVQSDFDNGRLNNLRAAGEPTQLFIEVATPEGRQSGLMHDSLISCINLATIDRRLVIRIVGSLSAATTLAIP